MEAMLTRELTVAAECIGLSVSDPALAKAIETGFMALAEGHSFDVAVEVARSVLRPQFVAA